jgi:cation:H+ antiporter
MPWILFFLASVVVVVAAIKLAEYGDVISIRTGLGGMFIGLILMAGATSLPELLTTINAINQNIPDLAAGNMFGSNMFNMLLLGAIDLMYLRTRILRKVARRHALSGSFAVFLIVLATFFVLADIDIRIGWIGLDSILLMTVYVMGLRIIRSSTMPVSTEEPEEISDSVPSLKHGLIGFSAATLALVAIMPLLVSSSNDIAEITGLGAGFIGTALVAIVTSLPELVTTITAVRLKVYDMAIGNLFGSIMFNIFILGLSDIFMLDGRFMGVISDDFVLVGLIGLIMTVMALISNLAKLERKIWIIEIDAFIIVATYFLGMWFIFQRGLGI